MSCLPSILPSFFTMSFTPSLWPAPMSHMQVILFPCFPKKQQVVALFVLRRQVDKWEPAGREFIHHGGNIPTLVCIIIGQQDAGKEEDVKCIILLCRSTTVTVAAFTAKHKAKWNVEKGEWKTRNLYTYIYIHIFLLSFLFLCALSNDRPSV